jgi:hypothetical protein
MSEAKFSEWIDGLSISDFVHLMLGAESDSNEPA